MKRFTLLLILAFLVITFNSRAYAAFAYDITEFTISNGTNTFTDTFSDGIEPPPTPVTGVSYYSVKGTFASNRESGGTLELNSADAMVFAGLRLIGAGVVDSSYLFSAGNTASVTGSFEINDGFSPNTSFGVEIDNFHNQPAVTEGAMAYITISPLGSIFALWGDLNTVNTLDITGDWDGTTGITMSLLINTSNQLTAVFDYGSDGFIDLTISNFATFTFTPGNPDDVYNGGFIAVAPVPIPAAVWLFGSGLLGLIGFARRRKH